MFEQANSLVKNLKFFGLVKDEAELYLTLLANPDISALKLSKLIKFSRSKTYRVLEKLIEKGFVKELVKDYGTKYHPESYEKLNRIITDREEELINLKSSAPMLFNQLATLSLPLEEGSKILHYRGIEGLKQITWNSTKAEDILRIYEISTVNAFFEKDFAEKARTEFARNKVHVNQLTNFESFGDYTDVVEHVKYCKLRHLDSKELSIDFEVLIYNDIYCMYSYENEEIFCVEIQNRKLAQMQKQLFDFIWSKARKMKIISPNGAAVLED